MRRLILTYRDRRRPIAVIVSLLAIGAVLETISLVLLVPIAQAVATGNDEINRTIAGASLSASPGLLVGIAIASVVISVLVRLLTAHLQTRLVVRVEAQQRARLYDAFIRADWATQAGEPPGRFQWATGLTTSHADLLGILLNSSRYAFNLVTMIGAALLVAPVGAMVIIVVGIAIYVLLYPLVKASRRAQERSLVARQRQDEQVAELIPLIGEIRAYGAVREFEVRLSRDTESVLAEKRTSALLATIVSPIYQGTGMLIALGILAYATTRDLDVPALGAVALLLLRSLTSAQGIQNALHKYTEYRPVIDALAEWNRHYEAHREAFGDDDVGRLHDVRLRGVDFDYAVDTPALRAVDLTFAPGDHVGVVGPSGAGKSTLAQVLLRFRPPTRGRYQVNGVDASALSAESFSQEVAYVAQIPVILRGTVRENISLFRQAVDVARVEDAARRAGLSDWIGSLPEGFETVIGPDSHGFSGGQAQRIGIARALAGSPSMIVLDEPTSALDVDAEQLVTDAVRALPDHVIVVLIAHRMSTLRHCNRIVVLQDGRTMALGSTREVIEENDFFRRAVEAGALLLGDS